MHRDDLTATAARDRIAGRLMARQLRDARPEVVRLVLGRFGTAGPVAGRWSDARRQRFAVLVAGHLPGAPAPELLDEAAGRRLESELGPAGALEVGRAMLGFALSMDALDGALPRG